METQKEPHMGQRIYIGNSYHIDRPEDDIIGGLATICRISEWGGVGVIDIPYVQFGWNHLKENQEKWRKNYRDQEAYCVSEV